MAPEPASKPASYDGEKTSVATDINALVAGLGGKPQQHKSDEQATEVISGDALANFGDFGMFNAPQNPPMEDGTVEMQNPLSFIQQNQHFFGGGEGLGDDLTEMTMDEGSLKTEVASGIDFAYMSPPAPVQPKPPQPQFTPPKQPVAQQPMPPAMPPAMPPRPPVPVAPPVFGGGPAFNTGPRAVPESLRAATPPVPAMPPPTPVLVSEVRPEMTSQQAPQPYTQQTPLPPQQAPLSQTPPSGPDAQHTGPWKLKTDFGLTYEFQDTRSLTNWMSGRESLNNYELSAGDEQFYPWAAFSQISTQLSGGASGLGGQSSAAYQTGRQQPVAPAFPVGGSRSTGGFPAATPTSPSQSGAFGKVPPATPHVPSQTGPLPVSAFDNPSIHHQAPPSAQQIAESSYSPPSRDAKWNVLLWILFIMLALGCLALAAQIFGVVDFKQIVQMQPTPPSITEPASKVQSTGEPVPLDEPVVAEPVQPQETPPNTKPAVSAEHRALASTMIADARAEMEANHLATAREKLEAALVLDPKRTEVYMLLAKIYEQTGQDEKAREMRNTVQSLTADDSQMEEGDPIIP